MASAEGTFTLLENSPEMYQCVYKEVRRAPLRRFPFALFYVVKKEKVHVVAVFHVRRDPQGWKERISKSLAKKA